MPDSKLNNDIENVLFFVSGSSGYWEQMKTHYYLLPYALNTLSAGALSSN